MCSTPRIADLNVLVPERIDFDFVCAIAADALPCMSPPYAYTSSGSNYMPAKRVNTGDGFFFALVIALGIWFAGLIFTLIYSKGATSDFEPIAAIGGVLWATGNMYGTPYCTDECTHDVFTF